MEISITTDPCLDCECRQTGAKPSREVSPNKEPVVTLESGSAVGPKRIAIVLAV